MERVLKAFIAGFGLGFLAGILTAPNKGKTTRKKLVYKADLLKDQVEEALEDAADDVKRTLS